MRISTISGQALERRAAHPEDASLPDTVLIAQHSPVYTLGTGSTLDNLKFSLEEAPFDVVRTERGGEVTYHGPGQVSVLPLRLRRDRHVCRDTNRDSIGNI